MEIILDKGIVIDAYARVSLVGIELLTMDPRIVVASVDTYLRFAEATNRLDLSDKGGRTPLDLLSEGVGEVTEKVASTVVEHGGGAQGGERVEPVKSVVGGAVDKVGDAAEEVVDKADDLVQKVHSDE